MRADVLRILDPVRGIVYFSCESGSASARWMGAEQARMGRFDVELDFPEVEEWAPATSRATAISGVAEAGAEVHITCEILGVADDGVVEVRVGTGVVLVEIPDGRHDLPLGGLISFRTPEVQLHPYNL